MPNSAFTSAMRAGVTGEIKDTFKQAMYEDQVMRNILYRFIPTSKGDARQKLLSFKSATPFPSLWKYGESRKYKGIKDYFYSMELYNYELAITWNKFDEFDDQIGDVRQQAQSATNRFFQLQDVQYTEYLDGVKDLNPELKTAWTGTSLFNTVDGDGNDLFGAVGGNIISGLGTGADAIQKNLMQVQRRGILMKDPIANKPLFSPKDLGFEKMHCIVPASMNEEFYVASQSKFFKRSTNNNTSEDNVLQQKFSYSINPYLVDQNDWYVVINHPYWKPFLLRAPDSVETFMADESNSDWARDRAEYGVYMNVRTGLAPYMQNTIFKVSNT